MKKIFVLTGEPSGDKLASTIISKLKSQNTDIEYLSVGGTHLGKLGIKSIFNLKDITYLGFTSVIFNIFKIRTKINMTVDEIIKFKRIGKRTLVSDDRLPGKTDIIFFSLGITLSKTVFTFSFFSING